MTTIPLSKENFNQVIPIPTLQDLAANSSNSDQQSNNIENDIDYLLHWLSPFWPDNRVFNEPSPRVKSAVRSCLRDESSQLDFVKLYGNSIKPRFFEELSPVLLDDRVSLTEAIDKIKFIKDYYDQYIKYLNLNKLPYDILNRNLNSLFHSILVENKQSKFINNLTNYLYETLFGDEKCLHGSVHGYMLVLLSIELIDELNSIIIRLSIKQIKDYILATCTKVWDKPLLEEINCWIKLDLFPSFSLIMRLSNFDFSEEYLYDLIKIAHDELVSLRIKEIFGLVVDYPNSYIALSELHQCLLFKFNSHNTGTNISNLSTVINSNINTSEIDSANSLITISNFSSILINNSANSQAYQRAKLVDTFIQLCHEELLHSGANTVNVITCYTSTIKSFLIIDPKGVLLDRVVRPIRRYLKTREDIIIKLVHGLLDQSESNDLLELAQELRNGTKKTVIADDLMDLTWVPDPIDALPDFKKSKMTDIIESLISIFDLKEIFINEFTQLFGERLINLHDYDVKDVTDHLDLLKLRFGENEFTTLDIMIKDIEQSKITNEKINYRNEYSFHSTILSHLYWPTVCENISHNDSFQIPDTISNQFEKFDKEFARVKKGRGLKLLPSLGLVRLELLIRNTNLLFEVTPDKASIISLFHDKVDELRLTDIATQLDMQPYVASKAIDYWIKQNVLTETSKGTYKVNE